MVGDDQSVERLIVMISGRWKSTARLCSGTSRMLPSYDFFAPGRILSGCGRRKELGSLAAAFGRRAFVVSGSRTLESSGVFSELLNGLQQAGVAAVPVMTISHEPEVQDVDELTALLVKAGAGSDDCLVAVGGGSALDLTKAASAMSTNRESSTVRDYLEGVGAGLVIQHAPLPLIALPTTAGTGTEATKNAVISSYDPPFKKSLRSELMVPRAVLIDPELSIGLSPQTTAYTGMDAITQLLESFISRRARPIPEALCLQGLSLAVPSLTAAVEEGSCVSARSAMAHAALLSGMALANSGLGLAHGVAAGLGVLARIPHGLACAVMLPVALRANREASRDRLAIIGRTLQDALLRPSNRIPSPPEFLCDLARESQIADDDQAADLVIALVEALCERLRIPRSLSALGVTADMIPALVPASRGNSMSGNPRDLSDGELTAVLNELLISEERPA